MWAVRKKFIISLTVLTVAMGLLGALVFGLLLPERYFAAYPFIPVFFYLFGLFFIAMFERSYQLGQRKVLLLYLAQKAVKLVLSVVIMAVYALAVGEQVPSFLWTFLVYYVVYLIYETRFFSRFELKNKSNKYNYK